MLDETHLGAWLDAKFSTKPSWNDNPTPRCYIDRIHISSVLKNASDSHEFFNPQSFVLEISRFIRFLFNVAELTARSLLKRGRRLTHIIGHHLTYGTGVVLSAFLGRYRWIDF